MSTLADFLHATVSRCADQPALGSIRDGQLQWHTWQQVADAAAHLAGELRLAGITFGDRVAQVSENRYEWIISDLSLHLIGAVHVPIHVTLSGQQIAEQITDCGASLVLVSSRTLLEKFEGFIDRERTVWVHDEPRESGWHALKGRGVDCVQVGTPFAEPQGVPTTAAAPSPQLPAPVALATILYTSGTTGRPRGVMLSHSNLAANAAATAEAFSDEQCETRLGILPLSHIFARTCDLYTWVLRGSRLVLAESRETLARDLQLAKPTALNAVPYVYQKIADRIRSAHAADEAATLRAYFGGQIQLLNCGGAPLAPDVERWFADRGLPILPGYGLTETAPVISVSTHEHHRFGSVGRVLPNVDARIAADGELLVRGPSVMLGYWQEEDATRIAIRNGWLHTGDLAELDADGFLFIRGRKKELIVLATGKKVVPTRVETLLTASPLIEQAAVFGDGRPTLIGLIVPAAGGLASDSNELREKLAAETARCLACASVEEQVRDFIVLDEPFSIERGELTAKLSLCRSTIAKNHAQLLKQLSEKAPTATTKVQPS